MKHQKRKSKTIVCTTMLACGLLLSVNSQAGSAMKLVPAIDNDLPAGTAVTEERIKKLRRKIQQINTNTRRRNAAARAQQRQAVENRKSRDSDKKANDN